MLQIKVMGMDGTVLWENDCEYWENDGNMIRIHVMGNQMIVKQTIGIPTHNIKWLVSSVKEVEDKK